MFQFSLQLLEQLQHVYLHSQLLIFVSVNNLLHKVTGQVVKSALLNIVTDNEHHLCTVLLSPYSAFY